MGHSAVLSNAFKRFHSAGMEKKHYVCTRFESTIPNLSDFHASDTVQFHTVLCVPVLAHHLCHTLQEVRHRQKDADRISVHLRGALLLPCALLHHRVAPPDGVPLDTLFTVGYPLYYAYICCLVSRPNAPFKLFLLLLPGITVAAAKFLFPGGAADSARQLLFAVQVLVVVYAGYRKLRTFDREIADVYADTDGRDTTAVKHLLIAFMVTSLCSAVANALGRPYFAQNDWLTLAAITPFSVMLFTISYIGFIRDFPYEQFVEDSRENIGPPSEATPAMEESKVGKSIGELLVAQQLYLTPNLKIGDVAKATGICRTYISNYMNQTKGMSFSDYINSLRVEHAKTLLSQNTENAKIVTIATRSGFSSEQSFYRNFHKFTGMKPLEWVKQQQHPE